MEDTLKYDDIIIAWVIVALVIIVVMSIVSYKGGYDNGVKEMEQQSVSSGHAEYYIDKKFNKQWRWKKDIK